MIEIKGEWSTRRIWLNNQELHPAKSQAEYNHSPDGFCWGYGGSGPSQLALAIMLEIADKEKALNCYQRLKWDVIAKLPQGDFQIKLDETDYQ